MSPTSRKTFPLCRPRTEPCECTAVFVLLFPVGEMQSNYTSLGVCLCFCTFTRQYAVLNAFGVHVFFYNITDLFKHLNFESILNFINSISSYDIVFL